MNALSHPSLLLRFGVFKPGKQVLSKLYPSALKLVAITSFTTSFPQICLDSVHVAAAFYVGHQRIHSRARCLAAFHGNGAFLRFA